MTKKFVLELSQKQEISTQHTSVVIIPGISILLTE